MPSEGHPEGFEPVFGCMESQNALETKKKNSRN